MTGQARPAPRAAAPSSAAGTSQLDATPEVFRAWRDGNGRARRACSSESRRQPGPRGQPAVVEPHCTYCGFGDLEPGFVADAGDGARGYSRWVQGALERGPFGGARLMGRPKWQIDAYRCTRCGHLELFATQRV